MNHLLANASYFVSKSNDGLWTATLYLRVVVGVTLAAHGYNKFFGGGKIAGTARWFTSMGMKPNGTIHAYLAACTEIGAGLMFAAGLLTPFAAAGMVGVMFVAAWTHRKNGFFIVKDGWEYNMVIAAVAIAVATMGPGRYSLDWMLKLDLAFTPKLAFGIAAGLGFAAPIALLAACYRPPAEG